MERIRGYILYLLRHPDIKLRIIEISVLVILAYASALIVNNVISSILRVPPKIKSVEIQSSRGLKIFGNIPTQEMVDNIKGANIFRSSDEPTVSEPPSDNELAEALDEEGEEKSAGKGVCPVPQTNMRARLSNIIYAPRYPELHSASIIDLGTQELLVLKEGDSLMQEATVQEIHEDYVILDHGGKRECMQMTSEEQPTPPSKQAEEQGTIEVTYIPKDAKEETGDESGGEAVKEIEEEHYSILRSVLSKYVQNIDSRQSQVKVVPNFENGNQTGFKFLFIRKGSVYEKLGLKEGDVLVKAGGMPIPTVKEATNAFNKLRTESEITITLNRGGEETELTYDLR